MSSIQKNFVQNPKFMTDNRHGSRRRRVLISNINTPLHSVILFKHINFNQNINIFC